MTKKVIVDGDWGGDEMQLAAVLLAHDVEILGATCTFGNAPLKAVTKNACDILALLGAPDIKVYAGAEGPIGEAAPEGDGAHGDDGVGGVALPEAERRAEKQRAADFILETLRTHEAGTISITATGPLSNIAEALSKDPFTMRRAKEIVIMGGCTKRLDAADIPSRMGNITPFAEFNFYMAPKDADFVLSSHLPFVLMPMNCTQHLSVTPGFEQRLRQALQRDPEKAELIIAMMKAPEALDKAKFNASPFMHDVNTALYLVKDNAYRGRRGTARVITDGEMKGMSVFTPAHEHERGNIYDQIEPNNIAQLQDIVLNSLQSCVERPLNAKRIPGAQAAPQNDPN